MSVGKVVLLLCYTCKQWWTKGWGARGKAERDIWWRHHTQPTV